MGLYFEAGRPRQAAALAEELSWPMRRAGRLTTLEGWAARCAQEGCRAPWLFLEYAGSCTDHGQFERALDLIDHHLLVPQSRLPARIRLRALTARGMLLYQAGRMAEVGPALERARACLAAA